MSENNEVKHVRRVRYKGTHPRRFEEKYKELDPNGSRFLADRTEVMGYDMTDTSLTKNQKKKMRNCFSYEVYKNTTQLATQLKCMVGFLEDAANLTGV